MKPITVNYQRTTVSLNAETISLAKKIGEGNLSAGLRKSVKIAAAASTNNSKDQTSTSTGEA